MQLFDTEPPPPENAASTQGRFALIAIEQGIDAPGGGLTYAVPEALEDLAVGERVIAPLGRGNKKTSGYVVGLVSEIDFDPRKVKPLIGRDPAKVSLTPDLVELAKWMAAYYLCPLGMVLATMLPAAVKKQTGSTEKQRVRLAPTQPVDEKGKPVKLTKLQQGVLDQATDQWVDPRWLADQAGAKSTSAVKQLIQKKYLEAKLQEMVVSDLDLRAQSQDDAAPPTLNESQHRVLDNMSAAMAQGFGVHLLHGVTGSGKTEVYLRLIEHLQQQPAPPPGELSAEQTEGVALTSDDARETQASTTTPSTPSAPSEHLPREGRGSTPPPGVIVLVPEIALTPQTVGRFLKRFDKVAVLHSGLTSSQRHAQWRRIATGEATIVVGARSALFAPMKSVRLIIVDEEHDGSYKQDQLPRYHARDCAVKRAQLVGASVILGSATPSLESYFNCKIKPERLALDPNQASKAENRKFHYQSMPDRVAGLSLPKVDIINLRESNKDRKGIHLLTPPLEKALEDTASRGRQTILMLNRRGYANAIICPDQNCGWNLTCNHCDAAMVYHKNKQLPAGGYVRCHHCQSEVMLPQTCPQCQRTRVTVFGLGTQRVEEEMQRKFPGIKYLRMDSDTMRSAKDYQQTLEAFRLGEADVLLGTQMIAKGLDFANVSLVGVISADTSLNLPDFRAAERTFQLIAQVAGRAGRADDTGRVILQTLNPDDPTIQLASQHDFETFADQEIAYRQNAGLPPVGRMARIVLRDPDQAAVQHRAHKLYDLLQQTNEQSQAGVRIRPPMACPIARIADHHRWQIELIAPTPGKLQQVVIPLRNQGLTSDQHTAIDIDPVSLL